MRTTATLRYLVILFLSCQFLACQKMTDEIATNNAPQALAVKTRSADNAEIMYPLYLYAFDSNGVCSASQTISQADEAIELNLAGGEYRIVAISGISGGYTLPDSPNAQSEILLNGTQGASTPMMMGKADVTISSKSTSLTLTLSYAVTVVSVALKSVPSDVSTVSLTLSPLYSSLSFSGEYGENTQKLEIPCTLDTENIWTANMVYAFPGSGSKTVFSIRLTKKDGSEMTYAYTYTGTPLANHPFNVSGNYAGSVTVGGELIMEGWQEAIDVEFDFGSLSSTEEEGTEETPEEEEGSNTTLTDIPEVGSIWNDGIVAEVNTSGNEATILSMSLEEWDSYAADVETLLDEYGTDGWTLPDDTQARALNAAFQDDSLTELNELLEANGYTTVTTEKRYLYNYNGEIYAFGFKSSSKFQTAGSATKYKVRLVRTTTYTVE